MLGTPRGRVIGKPFSVFVAQDDRAAFRTHLRDRMASSQDQAAVDLTLARSSNEPIAIHMVSSIAVDRSGKVVGCRSAFTDASERKRAEEALRFAVRMRQEFLATVSHELRNPLHLIMLGVEILRTEPSSNPRSLRGADDIHFAATQMKRLLGDLLDLSSMDVGHLSMDRKTERVETLLSTLAASASPAASANSVQLTVAIDAQDLVAYCDRDRVLQVLTNLVGNAIKFTGPGGQVHVEAKRTSGQIELAVRDTGPGMDKRQLEHVFDPYWQVPNTAKKGTGLGLSIAKGIIELHGGRIWAESELGRGSTFFFTLPAAAVHEPSHVDDARSPPTTGPLARATPAVTAEPVEGGDTILIVDDEPETGTLLMQLLRRNGYGVTTATDGAKALEYLRITDQLPFVILLDLVMPSMDGWQFLAVRSSDPRLAAIPVVLISGQIESQEIARALGLTSYITKPVEVGRLLEMLALIRRRPSATAPFA